MKRLGFIKQSLFFLGFFKAIGFSYAGMPLWTFTPLTATTISLPADSTATVQYQVTNQSSRAHTLAMSSVIGVSQITTGTGVCPNPFTLPGHGSCTLSLQIDGRQATSGNTNGPVVCEQGSTLQCYRPSPSDTLNITAITNQSSATLSISVSNLALETSGNSRTITITNTGSISAENLSISYPTWPSGTTANSNCGSSLGATDTCTITVNPGANATSNCNSPYSEPTPGVITVSADNVTSAVTTDVYVLTYGCIYEKGYIFAIDDTTSANTSINGTTVALADNSSGIQWYNDNFVITNAESLTNGATNTVMIINTQGAGSYAAEICANYTIDSSGNSPCSTGTCYSNWYLPAICQMGASGEGAGCLSGTANMVSNLPNLIFSGCIGSSCLSGNYWSSTEYFGNPQAIALYELFISGGGLQFGEIKDVNYAVRCSRNFTN